MWMDALLWYVQFVSRWIIGMRNQEVFDLFSRFDDICHNNYYNNLLLTWFDWNVRVLVFVFLRAEETTTCAWVICDFVWTKAETFCMNNEKWFFWSQFSTYNKVTRIQSDLGMNIDSKHIQGAPHNLHVLMFHPPRNERQSLFYAETSKGMWHYWQYLNCDVIDCRFLKNFKWIDYEKSHVLPLFSIRIQMKSSNIWFKSKEI